MGQVGEGKPFIVWVKLTGWSSVTNGRGMPLASLEMLEIAPNLILPAKGLS